MASRTSRNDGASCVDHLSARLRAEEETIYANEIAAGTTGTPASAS